MYTHICLWSQAKFNPLTMAMVEKHVPLATFGRLSGEVTMLSC